MRRKSVVDNDKELHAAAGSTVGSIVSGPVTKSSGGHGACLAPGQMVLQDFS